MYWPNLKSVPMPVPDIIAIEVLAGGCEPPILRRGGLTGSGMVPSERELVSFYRRSVVTFPISLHVSDILPHLCSSKPLYPTQALGSPKFLRVRLGVDGWRLGSEERRCWANCTCS